MPVPVYRSTSCYIEADNRHDTYHRSANGKCVHKRSSFLQASPRRNAADDSVAVARAVRDFAGTWNIKSRSGTCAGPSAES